MQGKRQGHDKWSFFGAKTMNPYLCRPRNVTLTIQISRFWMLSYKTSLNLSKYNPLYDTITGLREFFTLVAFST